MWSSRWYCCYFPGIPPLLWELVNLFMHAWWNAMYWLRFNLRSPWPWLSLKLHSVIYHPAKCRETSYDCHWLPLSLQVTKYQTWIISKMTVLTKRGQWTARFELLHRCKSIVAEHEKTFNVTPPFKSSLSIDRITSAASHNKTQTGREKVIRYQLEFGKHLN